MEDKTIVIFESWILNPVSRYHLASAPHGTIVAIPWCGGIMVEMDLRDRITPFALLEVIGVFKRMQPGETLEVRGNDDDLRRDLDRILPGACYRIVSGAAAGEYVACIRKPVGGA
jgi:TusA-related sulfurtransferase